MKYEIWHNILWSKYKARVFSELSDVISGPSNKLIVYQIAETEGDRIGLSGIDMRVHRYPMQLLFRGSYENVSQWRRISTLGRLALVTDADVVLLAGYHLPEYIVQAFILWARGKPRAVFCDSTAADQPMVWWKRVIKRITFGMCQNVFCYGERAKAYVIGLGVRPENAFTRCQAAALPDGYDNERARGQRLALAASVDAPLFLYVGRLSPEKRLDVLIRAFAEVGKAIPAARLRLVGSGPQSDELRALVRELSLGDAVEFTGGQSADKLFANYSEATALVLPSYSEPWGLVVNEALHFGCPVIVSERCGCVPELVENSPVGMVVRCDDVGDLAEKMAQAPAKWSDQPWVADECQRVIAPFSPRNAALAIMNGLEQIVGRAKRG